MKLKELGEIITGNTPSKKVKDYYESNDISFFKPGDLDENYILELKKSEEYISEKARGKARIIPKNSILVTCIGTIGKVGILLKEASCNQQINAIIPNKKVLPKYLAYSIFSKQKYIQKKANAPVVPIINKSDFSDIDVKICDLDTQRLIVQKLDSIKNVVDIKKKQITELDNLIKSQFVDMFITNRNDSWRLKKLKEVCIFNPKKLEISNVPDDFKVSFIPMTAVTENGEIDTSDIRDYKEVNRGFTYFRENDVLFAKITPCMENGKGAVAINLKNKIGFGSTEFHVVRPKETMNSRWLYTLFSLSFFRNEAEKNMTGSAGQKRVPIKFIENYEIFVPPIELQNKFASFVEYIDKLEFAIVVKMDSPNG
jgi:type I restriction enzyme, S subunit